MPPPASASAVVAEPRWHLPPIRGMVTLLAGEGMSRILSFLAIALLTRRLGAAAWGPVAVALSAAQFGLLVVEMGMRLLGTREVARDHASVPALVRPIVATQTFVALLLVVVATALWWLEPGDVLRRLLPGYALSLVAVPFYVPWIFQGFDKMEWVAIPQVTRYAAFLVLAAVLVTTEDRATWLPWVEAASVGGGALVALWAARRASIRVPFSLRGAFHSSLFGEALPIAASQVLWVVRFYLPTLVLWILTARATVGRYDVAHRMLMVLNAALTVYLANLMPSLSRAAHGTRSSLVRLLASSSGLAFVASLASAVVLAKWAGPVLGIVNGAAFNHPEAAGSLALLAFIAPVMALRGHAHYALVALGRQTWELACNAAGIVVLGVLLAVWVPGGGARGAALSLLVAEAVGMAMTVVTLAYAIQRLTRDEG